MAVPPAPVRVPAQRPLAPSVTSVTSVTNDKGGNGMLPRAVKGTCGIFLMAEETRGTSARRPSDEGSLRSVIASNGLPYLQLKSVGSHNTSGKEKEGKKERTPLLISKIS